MIKSRVGKINVFLVEPLLGQLDGLAEPLEVDDLSLTK